MPPQGALPGLQRGLAGANVPRGGLDPQTYARLRQAQALIAAGERDAGLVALRALADERANVPQVLQAYIEALLSAGEYATAAEYLETRLAAGGDAWFVRSLLARAQFLGGQKGEASTTWSAMLSARAQDENAYREVGAQRLALGDLAGAEATYTTGRRALKSPDAFALELEQVHKAGGRFDDALQDCVMLLRRPLPPGQMAEGWVIEETISLLKIARTANSSRASQTLNVLEGLAAAQPGREDLRRLALRAALVGDKPERALRRAEEWDALRASSAAPSKAGASALLELAHLAEESGDSATAAAAVTRALSHPLNAEEALDARMFLAQSAERAGRLEEALTQYRAITSAEPAGGANARAVTRSGLVALHVAELERKLGRMTEAIASYTRLIDRPPPGVPLDEARLGLAECYLAAGKNDSARVSFDRVAQSATAPGARERAAFEAAEASFYLGDYKDASERYRALADVFPDGALVNDALSRILLIAEGMSEPSTLALYASAERDEHAGRLDRASATLEQLVAKSPRSALAATARFRLGEQALAAGRVSEALQRFAFLADSLSDARLAPDALKAEADIYADRLGDSARALELYTRFLTQYPDHVFASEVRLRADKLRRAGVKGS
jgi:TolA-binding protein